MNMAVNLSKNGAALMAAYKEVVDGKMNTNWALFTYEGNSNDIRLAEKGDGGLEEMVEELNSGKVMYAFCRVEDPNSGLPKYVLVNWTGEGVKDSRKGLCANHVSSMANFLKGAHVTINARGDDDVEPETILAKVSKASGANFNFHQKTEYRDAPRGPVGSVYRKVNAVEEIQQTKKDDFWIQTQRDAEVSRQEDSKRAEGERQRMERERMEMEVNQTRERERKSKERGQRIEQDKLYQRQREQEEEREQQQQRQNQQGKETKRTGISAAASVQKANEAKSLISQRSVNPRDVFKQREQSFEASDRSSTSRPGKLQSPFLSQKSFERETLRMPQFPTAVVKTSPVHPPSPVQSPVRSPVLSPVHPPSPVQSPVRSLSPVLSPVHPVSPVLSHSPPAAVYDTLHPSHSPVQPAGEEEWSDEFEDDADEATPAESQDYLYVAAEETAVGPDESLYDNVEQGHRTAEENGADANGENICARAVYDYQAVDDTEITFDPDDIISGIDMVDEGWWRGYGPDGHYGMFPANYVELL
ncbi:drebrin-like a isoform X1 [Hippoglossus hippoglossus]|uniref:drebrin-like a isoform X1 n=1 Tax=Hippoglossus hippoglossus TaxID=8267 RepID=UPI00148B8BCE|nr:drebrin-like a isoform X1 [Hippoglossus hippoglossus]